LQKAQPFRWAAYFTDSQLPFIYAVELGPRGNPAAAFTFDIQGGDGAGGGDVCTADGMLLDGNTLYVVQNFLNRVAVVDLSADHFSGVITRYITEPFTSNAATKVSTTIAE
jgi:hypothetical protein